MDCDFYGACLSFASAKNWKAFHCTGCTYEDQDSGIPLCNDCLEKEPLGSSPYCASCLGIRGNKAKAEAKAALRAQNEAAETSEKAKEPQGKPKDRKPLGDANTALRIDFGKHVSILREVEKVAEKEIRSVDLQVIYILKNYLKSQINH